MMDNDPVQDQAKTLRSHQGQKGREVVFETDLSTRVIAVASGKGGVGKTSVVANLAVAWAKQGLRVLIIDADLGLANIDVVFGLSPRYTLSSFFLGQRGLEQIMTPGPYGIKLLPAGSGVQDLTRLDPQQRLRFMQELEQFSEEFDCVLIDTGAGISENVTYFSTAAQTILVVTTPQITSITDAYALIKLLALDFKEEAFHLLVNFVSGEKEAIKVYEKMTLVTSRFLDVSVEMAGWLPWDKKVNQALKRQSPFVDLFPHSRLSASCLALAERLQDKGAQVAEKGIPQFFWERLLRLSEHRR